MLQTFGPLGIVLAVLIGIGLLRPVERRARHFHRCGLIVMGIAVLFMGLFIAGETFTDPGGWQAAGLVAGMAAAVLYLLSAYAERSKPPSTPAQPTQPPRAA
jgi:peptidoglycan/LPS O-acetylase OafA/YrhL